MQFFWQFPSPGTLQIIYYIIQVIHHIANFNIFAHILITDEEKKKFVALLSKLKLGNLINTSINDCFKMLCNEMKERENETTIMISAISILLSSAVTEKLITLSDVAALTDNGAHYPLFLLVLQNLHKAHGKNELTELFNNSKVNLLSQLPENDKTKERLAEILEEGDLTFLYPLLRIQAELAKQLQADPNPQQFYKWIKENLDSINYTDAGFINALMTVLLKYITQVNVMIRLCRAGLIEYFSFFL